jgi:uncharacterized protein DUF4124
MKMFAAVLTLAALSSSARAEEVWRWTDAGGTLHYSNRAAVAPPDATTVTTRLIVETDRLPGAPVIAAAEQQRAHQPAERRPHRIYTEERLRFGCYAANVLYAGGWSHPDDINAVGNCLPYRLGPEAWLNAARAELALRENGIDWREVVQMYLADREPELPRRVTTVNDAD